MYAVSLIPFNTVLVIDKNNDVVNTMGVEIPDRVAYSDINGKIHIANLFRHTPTPRDGRIAPEPPFSYKGLDSTLSIKNF